METTTSSPRPQPLKRHPNLVPLSREHHFSLLFAWKIKQGLARQVSPEVLRAYVRYFWEQNLQEHLEKEEEILLQGLPEEEPLLRQLLEEHAQILTLVNQILELDKPATRLFRDLRELVVAHIRFEEREFFPFLENKLTPRQLHRIGTLMQEHDSTPEDDFAPEF